MQFPPLYLQLSRLHMDTKVIKYISKMYVTKVFFEFAILNIFIMKMFEFIYTFVSYLFPSVFIWSFDAFSDTLQSEQSRKHIKFIAGVFLFFLLQ